MIVYIYMAAWLGLVALAILNGLIREKTYKKKMGDLGAHQLSTLTGLILFSAYIFLLTRICPLQSGKQAIAIGLIWMVMTVIFEFIFGHYVMKHSWSKLLADYNIFKGRLWLLILIFTTIAPYFFYWLGQ